MPTFTHHAVSRLCSFITIDLSCHRCYSSCTNLFLPVQIEKPKRLWPSSKNISVLFQATWKWTSVMQISKINIPFKQQLIRLVPVFFLLNERCTLKGCRAHRYLCLCFVGYPEYLHLLCNDFKWVSKFVVCPSNQYSSS